MIGSKLTSVSKSIKLSWLDLRGSGLSVVERLCLEEALLRHDHEERSWAIVGTHEPLRHRYLKSHSTTLPLYVTRADEPNNSCVIVMGIGGKPLELLNTEQVKQDGVVVLKRFSGGGTVVLDHSSIWTTFIGRTKDFTHVDPYPRSIMKWSADAVFSPAFLNLEKGQLNQQKPTDRGGSDKNIRVLGGQKTLVPDTKSCGMEVTGSMITVPSNDSSPQTHKGEIGQFALRENDYVLGERKMGGNAQMITKGAWLHHTSFLWDYDEENMEYLTLPKKRPDYRQDRSHDEFLVKLKTVIDDTNNRSFFNAMKDACSNEFELDVVTLNQAMEVVHSLGGMGTWLAKSRTRIIDDF